MSNLKQGNPGNKGGGRTSNEARKMIRGAITEARVKKIAAMIDKGKTESVRLQAFKALADIGIAKEIETVTADAEVVTNRIFAGLAGLVSADEYDRLTAGILEYLRANS